MPKINDLIKNAQRKAALSVRMKYWSTEKLMDEYRACYEAVHLDTSYGMYEMVVMATVPEILYSRGYQINIKVNYDITYSGLDANNHKVFS